MKTITLYRVIRPDGGTDITPEKPDNDNYTTTYRLIADHGHLLTDGTNIYYCLDTDMPEAFSEIIAGTGTEDDPYFYTPNETITKAGFYYTDEEILCVAFKTMRAPHEETLQELLGTFVAQVGGFEE